jgi:cation transport regulator
MHYESINELPKSVRNLPKQAKNLYLKAANSAWDEQEDQSLDELIREKAAQEAAWAAVKLEYEKDADTGEWVKIGEYTGKRSRHAMKHRRSKSSGSTSQARAHA